MLLSITYLLDYLPINTKLMKINSYLSKLISIYLFIYLFILYLFIPLQSMSLYYVYPLYIIYKVLIRCWVAAVLRVDLSVPRAIVVTRQANIYMFHM